MTAKQDESAMPDDDEQLLRLIVLYHLRALQVGGRPAALARHRVLGNLLAARRPGEVLN
jgi:hypothetical protein